MQARGPQSSTVYLRPNALLEMERNQVWCWVEPTFC
jgi:hypothetical protein